MFVEERILNRCPNPACGAHYLSVKFSHGAMTSGPSDYPVRATRGELISEQTILPSVPIPLSAHVLASIRQDYEEAHRIRELSPKASATLSRRALQGMIRHFWGVTKERLADELKAIKDQCGDDVYAAMMAVKSVGNIGAHPERDISLIVDVEPGEAVQLIELLQLLDAEWYVAKADRDARLAKMHALGQAKAWLGSDARLRSEP